MAEDLMALVEDRLPSVGTSIPKTVESPRSKTSFGI